MIVSFRDADTEALASGRRVSRFVNIEAVARRKLRQLEIAGRLEDLRVPPGNHLKALKHERLGQHSIRVNDQFRVCFRWTEAGRPMSKSWTTIRRANRWPSSSL